MIPDPHADTSNGIAGSFRSSSMVKNGEKYVLKFVPGARLVHPFEFWIKYRFEGEEGDRDFPEGVLDHTNGGDDKNHFFMIQIHPRPQ